MLYAAPSQHVSNPRILSAMRAASSFAAEHLAASALLHSTSSTTSRVRAIKVWFTGEHTEADSSPNCSMVRSNLRHSPTNAPNSRVGLKPIVQLQPVFCFGSYGFATQLIQNLSQEHEAKWSKIGNHTIFLGPEWCWLWWGT